MIIPPVTPEYDTSSQAILNEVLTKSDGQNFKLDQDNFLTTGSICLQNVEGDWFKLGIRSSATGYAVILVGTVSDNGDHADSGEIFTNVPLGGGTGTGVLATVTVQDDGSVVEVTITSGGSGYTISDSLTIPNSIIGGAANATCVVSQIGTNSEPVLTITKLAGTQLDADGRPSIASINPYS
jgi:hypothetical protein